MEQSLAQNLAHRKDPKMEFLEWLSLDILAFDILILFVSLTDKHTPKDRDLVLLVFHWTLHQTSHAMLPLKPSVHLPCYAFLQV
jgi:hypothetical protein